MAQIKDITQEPEELTNIIKQEQETDSENEFQDSADLTKNNLEKITDSLLNAELSSDILLDHEHPQRDKCAKWILGKPFVNKLDPPLYINKL
ncbi:246_t:CDS:2 [Cetraspora pellucida]|uniref:246_t:CDS:1 n=1 Tax=Cetraspora pellucida TaxID=1433469 RepID=A0A9N8W6F0_9GLOM|nr:246_t:CDS:2 [Cetraspora pellucida]